MSLNVNAVGLELFFVFVSGWIGQNEEINDTWILEWKNCTKDNVQNFRGNTFWYTHLIQIAFNNEEEGKENGIWNLNYVNIFWGGFRSILIEYLEIEVEWGKILIDNCFWKKFEYDAYHKYFKGNFDTYKLWQIEFLTHRKF